MLRVIHLPRHRGPELKRKDQGSNIGKGKGYDPFWCYARWNLDVEGSFYKRIGRGNKLRKGDRHIPLRCCAKWCLDIRGCVNKLWLSLISDPKFGVSHYDLAIGPSHRLLLVTNHIFAESLDIDDTSKAVRFILPPISPPSHGEQRDHADLQKPEVLGACRGLILLYYDKSSDLILWNPSISFHKLLPNFDYGLTLMFLYGFWYDKSSDDYLLILIGGLYDSRAYDSDYDSENDDKYQAYYQIFSFKTASYDMDDFFYSYESLGERFRVGTLFNEALHWIVYSQDKLIPVILVFDVIQRSFSEISLVDHFTGEKYEITCLRVVRGCLGVEFLVRSTSEDEIWVMEEYKRESSWTKITVVPTTKDIEMIESNIIGRGRIEKLRAKKELIKHLIYGGDVYTANLRFAIYRESLLSLSGDTDTQETTKDYHPEAIDYDCGETTHPTGVAKLLVCLTKCQLERCFWCSDSLSGDTFTGRDDDLGQFLWVKDS
ncbi:hypothetical protein VNO78_03428 [Psophocarpus tetragonolobus]|uniref:F-box associated beta-propeller type 1 domain-containing protein n=1 Tax=Psophocarpus tetragonolobus TaxID=3891 RepID=A0AAN9T1G2_PSOTE